MDEVAAKEVDVKTARGERASALPDDGAEDVRLLKAELSAAQATIQGLRRRIVELKTSEQSLRALQREHSLLEARYQEALRAIADYSSSQSWRLTSPLRWVSRLLRYALRGAGAWASFRPGTRPRRVADRLVMKFAPGLARPAVEAPGALEASPTLDGGPKCATRYIYVGESLASEGGGLRMTRGLSRALQDAGHTLRYVKWDSALGACVFIDIEERARLARGSGPPLTPEEAAFYPPTGAAPIAISPPPNAGAWLYVAEAQTSATVAKLIAWARETGIRSGFVVHQGDPEPEAAGAERTQTLRALAKADTLWPLATTITEELEAMLSAPSEAARRPVVRMIPLAAPDRPRGKVRDGDKLILCVGAGEDPKWHVALIQVFQEILEGRHGCDWRLVLAGDFDPRLVRHMTMGRTAGSPVEFLGDVPEAELASLYEWCAFTVAPAPGEAAAFAVVDSLGASKPCVSPSNGAAGEAAAAGGCIAVDVSDREALKTAIRRLIDDEALRGVLAEQAAARPLHTWSDYVSSLESSAPAAEPLIYYWVDSTVMVPVNTGIQRVVRQLARGLLEAGYPLVPVKWGGIDDPLRPVGPEELEHFAKWNGPPADLWRGWIPPRAHKGGGWFIMGELPHNLSDAEQKAFRAEVEDAGLKTAAVFYDTIPWKMPGLYPAGFSAAHLNYMGELYNYTRVLAISDYSRREMMAVLSDEYAIPEGRMDHLMAAPLAAEFPEVDEQIAAEPLPDGVVEILCVGTVEPRKNHERLLDAFELASERSAAPLHLTIVGGGHSFEPDLAVRVKARVDANPRIDWEQKADDARIKQLYARCAFTIYPSVEEGFGMPILESLWYGKPAICADFGAMFEVAEGGGCVTIDVRDVEAMASAMCDLANAPDRLARLKAEAKSRTFRTWRGYVEDVAAKLDLPAPVSPAVG